MDDASLAGPALPTGSFEKRFGRKPGVSLGRFFFIFLGLAAIVWALSTFPIFWRLSGIERTAVSIVNRETFKPHVLEAMIPAVEEIEAAVDCLPDAQRSAAIIRLRLAENAITSAERSAVDSGLEKLDLSVRRALSCTPTDAFLWVVLAWTEGLRDGLGPHQLSYLRLSYRLGPNEGWVAVRRNPLVLSRYSTLPPDLADAAVEEFARMVESGIYADTLAIFTGPGWPVHDRLLAQLKDVSEFRRVIFAKGIYRLGYDVTVPGVPPHEARPWD